MRDVFIWAGIALCLFALWALARNDWPRLTRPVRRVTARVTGHRASFEDGSYTYAAIYTFSDETGEHESIDSVYGRTRNPAEGTMRELTYPEGRPDLARPPRPLMWAAVYLLLIGLAAVLLAVWIGWLPEEGYNIHNGDIPG